MSDFRFRVPGFESPIKKGLANPRLREYLLPHESRDINEFLYVAILAQQGLKAALLPR